MSTGFWNPSADTPGGAARRCSSGEGDSCREVALVTWPQRHHTADTFFQLQGELHYAVGSPTNGGKRCIKPPQKKKQGELAVG